MEVAQASDNEILNEEADLAEALDLQEGEEDASAHCDTSDGGWPTGHTVADNSGVWGDASDAGTVRGPSSDVGVPLCGGPAGARLQWGCALPAGVCVPTISRLSGIACPQGDALGGLLWGITEIIIAPMLGAEVFSAALGGFPAAARALLGYLVYGATLGGIVGAADLASGRASRSARRIGVCTPVLDDLCPTVSGTADRRG